MSVEAALFPRDVVPAPLLRLASDERLVESIRAGSERAFEAVFDRHHRPVFAFCRHMLGSSADAEDAVQHTFLAAYRDLMRSEKPIALRPWLYTIARHRCLSVLRARRERPSAELPDAGVDNLAAEVDAREDVRTTFTDLARLPDDQRAALIFAELGDVSHEEIARILGCPRDKVKALVFQARTSLIADRTARETPCADIRAQLVAVGGALRHTTLRRHVRECPGCRAFRGELRGDRRGFGLLLPGAGLKRAVLSALLGSGGAGAGGAALTAGAIGGGGLAATALVAAAVASFGGPPEPSADAGAGRPAAPAATWRAVGWAGPTSVARHEPTAVARARAGLPAGIYSIGGVEGYDGVLPREAHGHAGPAAIDPAADRAAGSGPETDTADEQRSGPGATNQGGGEDANGRGRGAPPAPTGQTRGRYPGRPADTGAGPRGRGPAKPSDEPKPGQANRPTNPRSEPKPHERPAKPGGSGGPAKPDGAGGPATPPEPARPAKMPKDKAELATPPSPPARPPEAAAPPEHVAPPESSGPPPANLTGGSRARGGDGHDDGGSVIP